MKRAGSALLPRLSRLWRDARPPGQGGESRTPDVPFQPTPKVAVEQMLRLAGVHDGDVVYDLGCGDGRIPIAASKLCGARGIGIEIDPKRIDESLRNARAAGVLDRVTFRQEDLFEANISDATVVILFLWPEVNQALRSKLWRELKPGTRVVSYYWEIGNWAPEREIAVDGRPVYLWTIRRKRPRTARGAGPEGRAE